MLFKTYHGWATVLELIGTGLFVVGLGKRLDDSFLLSFPFLSFFAALLVA